MRIEYIIIQVVGLVQGVGFRYMTYQKARELGLTGYVRNLPNGNVEIVAGGNTKQRELLIEWLKNGGPRSAHIQDFAWQHFLPQENLQAFTIQY